MGRAFEQRLAGAPISWGVCEVPGWGLELPRDRVLAEMAQLGLTATELGAIGYLPEDPRELRELLDRYGLRLVGAFVPVVLHDPQLRSGSLSELAGTARRLRDAGAEVLVSAAVVDHRWSPRVPLDDAGWSCLLAGLDQVTSIAADHGLEHVLHPHVGTLVERAPEVRRVLDHSGVSFCLDSGHLAIGGYDPVEFARAAAARVRHVHLKDVEAALAARVGEGELSLVEAVQAGLFLPLGHGDAPIHETIVVLESSGYDGWYVLEQDVALTDGEPARGAGPVNDVRQSLASLRRSMAAVAGEA